MPMAAAPTLVPGEPGSGMLHPVQFHFHGTGTQQQPNHAQRIKGLAQIAKGGNLSAVAHNARDLLLSGSASPETQLGNAQVFRGANAY
jgi:hypothetical protein